MVGALLALFAVAPLGALAQGGDAPTRAEYVEEADRICEVSYRKALRLLGKADGLEGDGEYEQAGKMVLRAGRITLDVNDRLSSLVPPSADARLLEVWLKDNRRAFKEVVKAGKAFRADHPGRADRLLNRANRGTRRANKKVVALGFDFCA